MKYLTPAKLASLDIILKDVHSFVATVRKVQKIINARQVSTRSSDLEKLAQELAEGIDAARSLTHALNKAATALYLEVRTRRPRLL